MSGKLLRNLPHTAAELTCEVGISQTRIILKEDLNILSLQEAKDVCSYE